MEIAFRTEHDFVKGIDISLTLIEGLLLNNALCQFAFDKGNNPVDRDEVRRMCDEFETKMGEMAGFTPEEVEAYKRLMRRKK